MGGTTSGTCDGARAASPGASPRSHAVLQPKHPSPLAHRVWLSLWWGVELWLPATARVDLRTLPTLAQLAGARHCWPETLSCPLDESFCLAQQDIDGAF